MLLPLMMPAFRIVRGEDAALIPSKPLISPPAWLVTVPPPARSMPYPADALIVPWFRTCQSPV